MEGRIHEFQEQQLLDSRGNSGFGIGSELKSWPSDDDLACTLSSLSSAAAATGNVDPVLFNDLVGMVPLVESLIDRKENSSFTRRGSMIYTKTPSRESLYKKSSGRSANCSKKHRDERGKLKNNHDESSETFSVFSSRSIPLEKDAGELTVLRNQIEDLKRQISEKDEILKSTELMKSEMDSIHSELDALKSEAAEKESLIKSIQLQLSDVKIKLADKQAALEKFQWEAMTSTKKVENLQEDLRYMEGEISSFMSAIQGLTSEFSPSYCDYDEIPYCLDHNHELDTEMDVDQVEEARKVYIAAVAAANDNKDEESLGLASRARAHLQSLVLKQT